MKLGSKEKSSYSLMRAGGKYVLQVMSHPNNEEEMQPEDTVNERVIITNPSEIKKSIGQFYSTSQSE